MSDYRWQDDVPLDGCQFAARLQPGVTVLNSMVERADDPAAINVSHVDVHRDGTVTIHDVRGYSVRVAEDMCMQIVTGELADLMTFVVMAEQDRHLGGTS